MGSFEFWPDGRPKMARKVSREEAERLLTGHTRDVQQASARLVTNPFAQLACEGGTIRWMPDFMSHVVVSD